MTRRLITSLLTIAHFVGQLAVPPHAHGSSRENEPSDHGARLHFHQSWMTLGGYSHDNDHEHDQNDHDQVHHNDCAEHEDHDSDAIYLPNGAELSLLAKGVGVHVCITVFSNFAIATMAALPESFHASTESNSPDKCSPRCALYLALRALRI